MSRQLQRRSHTMAWLASAAVAVLCCACDRSSQQMSPSVASIPAEPATSSQPSVPAESTSTSQPSTAPIASVVHTEPKRPAPVVKSSDAWHDIYLLGTKIGYSHTSVRQVERDGRPLLQMAIECHFKLLRFGLPMDQRLKLSTLETVEGAVLEFRTELDDKPKVPLVTGKVVDGVMKIETTSPKIPKKSPLPWSDDIGGFLAIERLLERQPMQPGEKRSLKMLLPLVNEVANVELAAIDFESTRVLERTLRLLRIQSVARTEDGKETVTTLWTDESGRAVKTYNGHSQEESCRTSRETAIFTRPRKVFDVGQDLMVKLARPLPKGLYSRKVRYRVKLDDADPANLFSNGLTQSVRSVDPKTAEVTVRSVLPQPGKDSAATRDDQVSSAGSVDSQYLGATSLLETADPTIQAMARRVRGKLNDPHQIAVDLERHVKHVIIHKDYTQIFATAAEVARTHRGDCTEHSVLLAALARVCGIPSRVAIGLVYVEHTGGFGYHMWNEVLLDGEWIPLDATLGMGGIGAGHLKLTDSSLDGPAAHRMFAAGAQVVGQVKIEVLEAE